MLRLSMQIKILIFAIPFLIMVILHFIPRKKVEEEDAKSQLFEKEDKDKKETKD